MRKQMKQLMSKLVAFLDYRFEINVVVKPVTRREAISQEYVRGETFEAVDLLMGVSPEMFSLRRMDRPIPVSTSVRPSMEMERRVAEGAASANVVMALSKAHKNQPEWSLTLAKLEFDRRFSQGN